MDPASSPPWIYLFNILSAGACRSSTSSCCCALEYSISRFRRCATRASWSARTSTRASCRSSFSFASHFLQLCRHAGRREGLILPRDAAPRPTPSLLTLLPSPTSLLPFTPSLAPGVGVGGCGLGGREGGVILELTGISSTSSSLDARLTLALVLARRSLDPVTSTQRARLWRLRPTGGGRPFLRSVWVPNGVRSRESAGCGFGSIDS